MLSSLLIPMYTTSLYLGVSSSDLFSGWLALEINLISFLGMLKLLSETQTEVELLKYFLPQAFGSGFYLVGFFFSLAWQDGTHEFSDTGMILLCLALSVKLGLFPFYGWFISLSQMLTLPLLWWLSIPQKLVPFWVLCTLSLQMHNFTKFILIGGIFFSACSALTNARMGKILGYSSLFNSSWILLLVTNMSMFSWVFGVYGASLAFFVLALRESSVKYAFEFHLSSVSWFQSLMMFLTLINLGGLPPFLNMWTKVCFISILLNYESIFFLFLFILSSGVFAFVYLSLGSHMLFSQKLRSALPKKSAFFIGPAFILTSLLGFFVG